MIKRFGSDPEFICTDGKEYIALCGILGGTKDFPEPLDIPGCFKQEDNVLAELCVPPCNTPEEVFSFIDEAKKCVENQLPEEWTLIGKSSAIYSDIQLCTPLALEFGCTPSYSIYRDSKEKTDPGNLRSAGFHWHFEIENFKNSDIKDFIILCDLFLALPSLYFDEDTDRRKLYGNLGDFRIKKYGIEYRTLGSEMYNYRNVVILGLKLIQKLYYRKKEFSVFYTDLLKLENNINNKKIQNTICQKLSLFMEHLKLEEEIMDYYEELNFLVKEKQLVAIK